MQYLIIIRHGDFDAGQSHLNARGKEQMLNLAARLKELSPRIFSSVGPRSKESAIILAEELGTTSQPLEIFGTNRKTDEASNYETALDFLKKMNDNVVIVTKGEYANPFIIYLGKELLKREVTLSPLERGKGVQIDLATGGVKDI